MGAEPWFSAQEQAYFDLARWSEYLLEVSDAQDIGNTSEAWHVATMRLRDAVTLARSVGPPRAANSHSQTDE